MSKNLAIVALLLAVLFELTIFAEVPGLGFLLFWVAAVAGTVVLLRSAERFRADRLWMFLPSLLLAFSIFRFDGTVLRVWGSAVFVVFLAWAIAWNLVVQWTSESLASLFPTATWNPVRVAGHAQESLRVECRWEKETGLQVFRGLLFAVVLLLVFGTLLGQADAVFGSKLEELSNSFHEIAPAPFVRTGIWLGLLAGCLRLWILAKKVEAPATKSRFSPTELFISLGSLNILLATFLLVQVRYLFGDSTLVESLGFSHAEYARRGFFELTLCIGLILPLVLLAYRSAEVNRDQRLRWLGGGLILSAFGLAASALKRMFLYIDVYGLSVERFYAAAGILVAMTILGWAAFCCLKPQPVSWLVSRQKITVIFLLGLLSLVNVEALVVRSHLMLVQQGTRALDSYYLSGLGADTLPIVFEFEQSSTGETQQELTQVRQDIIDSMGSSRGFSFNISRSEARRFAPAKPNQVVIKIDDTHSVGQNVVTTL
jgi:Domain of unknown function (DUF4153)